MLQTLFPSLVWTRLAALTFVLVAARGVPPAHAQSRVMEFHSIGVAGHIAAQDSTGFIWSSVFGEGLARWDGTRLVRYRHDDRDSTSIPSDAVESLIPARNGGVWIGTIGEGAARYDPVTDSFERVLKGEYIMLLFEASDGALWAGTREGIIRYDPDAETLQRFPMDPEWVYAFVEDSVGDIWIATPVQGPEGSGFLYRYSPETDSLRTMLRVGSEDAVRLGLSDFGTSRILDDGHGTVFIGSNGVMAYDRAADSLYFPAAFEDVRTEMTFHVSQDAEGSIWVGTEDGVFVHRPRFGDTVEDRPQRPDDRYLPPEQYFDGAPISSFLQDGDGTVWLGDYAGAVRRVSGDPALADIWEYDSSNPTGKPPRTVQRMMLDRSGTVWINGGTWFYPTGPEFAGIVMDERDENGLTAGSIQAFARGFDGTLWMGSGEGGLFAKNPDGSFDSYKHEDGNANSLSADEVWSLAASGDGTLWVGTVNNGVNRIDERTRRITPILRSQAPIEPGSIPELAILRDGTLQVTSIWNMYHHDPDAGTWRSILDDLDSTHTIPPMVIRATAVDSTGRIWIVTQDSGVLAIDDAGKTLRVFAHSVENPSTLGSNDTYTVHVDATGTVWIGTHTGVFKVLPSAPDTLIAKQYSRSDGLAQDGALGFVDDPAGRIWIFGPSELSVLDPATDRIRTFGPANGLPSFVTSFVPGAVYWDPVENQILAGADGGVLAFDPERMFKPSVTPAVVIAGIARYNTENEAGTPIEVPGAWTRDEVTFAHTDNILEIELAVMSFANSDKNQFAYRLEGFSDKWFYLGERSTVTLTNLSPGKYTLWIRGANADGVWSEDNPAIVIRQLPPWWRSRVAYGIYGILAFVALFGVDRFQRRRLVLKERQRSELREAELRAETASAKAGEAEAATRALKAENDRKEIELEKARELESAFAELESAYQRLQTTQDELVHAEKMASLGQLTSGIAHEIKNPLNFVNNFAEVNIELSDELREGLSSGENVDDLLDDLRSNTALIREHGQRLDSIVHSMMQHASGQANEREPTKLNVLVSEHIDLASHGMLSTLPDLEIDIARMFDADVGDVVVVPQEIGRALLNLLSNAIDAVASRASATDGTSVNGYTARVEVSTHAVGDHVEIRVNDNGSGIPSDIRAKIFQPFFTTKPTGKGNTGLGLSLTYDIVTKGHGGTVTVESQEGSGTTFVISLPARPVSVAT